MSSQVLPAQAKDLFHYLFEQASLGIAVEDIDGTLLLVNPALCSMLGYAENELCGMKCSQFANPEDTKDDWALFQQLRAGVIDQYSLEKRYVTKNGDRIWGRLNVSLLKNDDGGSPLVFAFLENITERRRTEDALRESEQRFRLAAYAGKMFSYEWDASTDVVVRSGEYAEMLCTDKVSQLTTGQKISAKVHPEDLEMVLAADAAPVVPDPVTGTMTPGKLVIKMYRLEGSTVHRLLPPGVTAPDEAHPVPPDEKKEAARKRHRR